jgi:hypothetical protein
MNSVSEGKSQNSERASSGSVSSEEEEEGILTKIKKTIFG